MEILQNKLVNIKNTKPAVFLYYRYKTKEEFFMLKLLAKVAEKYAKNTNTACGFWWYTHQPKMPASLIKKD